MNERLKRCPFCGAEPKKWSWNYGTAIQCSNFSTSNGEGHTIQVSAKTEEEAIAKWNTRYKSRNSGGDVIGRMYFQGG